MRLFNKFVESKKEPSNKNDIWFDGSVFRIYKEEEWRHITLTQEAIDRIIEYAKSLDIYVMVDELPEFGEEGKIYVLQTIIGDSSVKLEEYIWEDNRWKLVDNFNSVSLVLDTELLETSHNAVANYVVTNKFKEVDEAIKNNKAREEKVTYAELVALRDAGKLSVGAKYRITDYVATTTQEKTAVISYDDADIDVIVTATTPSCLSEEASAILSDRVPYPELRSHIDYSGWKLWYSLDNDTERFAWADEINGKGVIYRMIDSFGNDLPFDFYSIETLSSNGYYYYTLPIVQQTSGELFRNNIKGNVIKPAYITNGNITSQTLNRIILTGILQKDNAHMIGNTFNEGCCDIVVTAPCRNLTFQKNIKNVVVKGDGNALTDTLQNYIFSENINNKTIQCKVNKDVTTFIHQDSDGNVIEMIPGDLPAAINAKQDTLVSGENIKTINGESVLGDGNIVIEGNAATPDWEANEEEEGFIKNKPFSKEIKQPETREDFTYSDYDESWFLDGLGNHSEFIAMVVTNDDGNEALNIFKLESGQTKVLDVIPYDGDTMLNVSVYKNDDDYYIDLPNNKASKEYVSNCIKEVFIKYIDDMVLPDTIARTEDLEELQNIVLDETEALWENVDKIDEEISNLSKKIENLPSGESSVFWAVYEQTKYEEIVAAYNEGKIVACHYDNKIYLLSYVKSYETILYASEGNNSYAIKCSNKNVWSGSAYPNTHSLKTLDNGNVELNIAGQTAEVATPQYVENLLGVIINGDY